MAESGLQGRETELQERKVERLGSACEAGVREARIKLTNGYANAEWSWYLRNSGFPDRYRIASVNLDSLLGPSALPESQNKHKIKYTRLREHTTNNSKKY